MALRVRGETVDEITGAVTAMRAKMLRVTRRPMPIDVVGTGGDASGSYNISTCAAFIVAGAGVPVAKHGNRALVLALGRRRRAGGARRQDRSARRSRSRAALREAGIGFMFAPAHHPAMKNVGPTRVELGTRTIFNLLGPLSNPAGVQAPDGRRVLTSNGRSRWRKCSKILAPSAHGSCTAPTGSTRSPRPGRPASPRWKNGTVRTFEISPEEVGLARSSRTRCAAATPRPTPRRCSTCSKGKKRRVPRRGAVQCRGGARRRRQGEGPEGRRLRLPPDSIDSGEAEGRLDRLIAVSNDG